MNLSRIGSDVLFFSTRYTEYPMQPRAAKIVGLGGGKDRFNLLVFNDMAKDVLRPHVEYFRNVPLLKPDAKDHNETHWLCDRSAMPKNGDWTLPPTIVEKPEPATK